MIIFSIYYLIHFKFTWKLLPLLAFLLMPFNVVFYSSSTWLLSISPFPPMTNNLLDLLFDLCGGTSRYSYV